MKIISTTLLAAALATLGACGGGAEENVAANDASADLYNTAPDDLGADNLLGNDALGNDALGNGVDDTSTNAAGNSTGNSAGNGL